MWVASPSGDHKPSHRRPRDGGGLLVIDALTPGRPLPAQGRRFCPFSTVSLALSDVFLPWWDAKVGTNLPAETCFGAPTLRLRIEQTRAAWSGEDRISGAGCGVRAIRGLCHAINITYLVFLSSGGRGGFGRAQVANVEDKAPLPLRESEFCNTSPSGERARAIFGSGHARIPAAQDQRHRF